MRFKLYSDASGTAFWTSDPRNVDVVGGKFAVTLGDSYDTHKLEVQDSRHSEFYVELMVDGTALNPRQRIAPVGQAIVVRRGEKGSHLPVLASPGYAQVPSAVILRRACLPHTKEGCEIRLPLLFSSL